MLLYITNVLSPFLTTTLFDISKSLKNRLHLVIEVQRQLRALWFVEVRNRVGRYLGINSYNKGIFHIPMTFFKNTEYRYQLNFGGLVVTTKEVKCYTDMFML